MLLELPIIGQRGGTLVLLCHGKLILMKDVESGRYSHMPLPRSAARFHVFPRTSRSSWNASRRCGSAM